MMPLTGPALGPIAGGWIVEKVSWRWIFYSTSIAAGVVQLLSLVSVDPITLIKARSHT